MSTTPPSSARSRERLAAVVVPVLLLALTGGLFALDRPFETEPGGNAARLLPADGDAERVRLQDGSVRAVEHARAVGAVGALAGPDPVNAAVIGAVGNEAVQSAHYWRQLTSTEDEQFHDLFVIGDDGLRQVASWGGAIGFTFEPGLLMLPADVAPGSTWSSSGSALGDGAITYDSEFTASLADERLTGADGEPFTPPADCLRVDGTLTFSQPGEGVLVTTTDTSVWCPGRGVVFSTGEQNGEPVGSVLDAGAALPDAPQEAGVAAAGSESRSPGRLEQLDAVVADPFFGDSVRVGSLTTAPALTPAGLVVTANEHGDDLLAWRPEEERAVLAWSAHPGGTIATVPAVGDLVVAATQDRTVRAYDELGRRLWSWSGDDLALASAIAAPGSNDVLVATRAGTLARLDAQDGRELWSTTLGADTRGAFAAAGDTVVVADERGRVSGLDAGTGELAWRVDAGMSASLAAGQGGGDRQLAYLGTEDGDVLAIDARTGETLWEASTVGLLRSVLAADGGVTVTTDEEIVHFRAMDGAEAWTAPGASAATAAGNGLLTVRDRVLALYGPDGALEGDWTLPDSADPALPRLLAGDDGAVVVGPAIELWRVALR